MTKNINYFSEKESKSLNRFKNIKDKLLSPFLGTLTYLKISPDFISITGLIVLVLFFVYFKSNPLLAFIAVAINLLMDGLDGALARYQNKSSNSGALTDILCDHTSMVITVITIAYYGLADPVVSITYVYIYTLMIIFIIIRNHLGHTPKYVFRSKYFLYLFYILWIADVGNYFDIALSTFVILMLPTLFQSYFVLKKNL